MVMNQMLNETRSQPLSLWSSRGDWLLEEETQVRPHPYKISLFLTVLKSMKPCSRDAR